MRSERIDAVASCSGFVADGGGYVVTAGHCVDPQDGRQALIHQLIVDLTTSGTLTDTEVAAVTPHALQSWQAGGATDGSPIDRQVSVFAGSVDSGASSAAGLTASVVELRPVDQGDIALLLVQAGTPLPALRVAPRESEVGAQIGVMGYPSGSDGAIDPSLAPTFIAGRTSARQSGNGLPYLQIDAALAGMSGAPVVDMSGDVVGVVSGSPFPQAAGFSFASAAQNVASLLTRNGVDRVPTESDRAFRDGLTSYFAGDPDGAVESFDRVLAVVPDHPVALDFRSKAAQSVTQHAEDRVGGTTASGVGGTKSQSVPEVPTVVSTQSSELPVVLWCGGIVLALLTLLGLAARWLQRRSGRSADRRTKATPVQHAVLAATRSGNGTASMAARRVEAPRPASIGSGNGNAARHAGARRNAVAPRLIPADMMCTTVPPDLMRTTVSPDLLRTTVMR